MTHRLAFVTRAGCHLCDEAFGRVERTARRLGFTVETIDVDEAGLAGRFGDRVPVVLAPGGAVVAEGELGGLWRHLISLRLRRHP